MEVDFNEKIYKKNGRNGYALNNLCFDIFKYYLQLHDNMDYKTLQDTFNQCHCSNNFVVLNKKDWETKSKDSKKRYFDPIEYNNELLYFTTQWGNNGGDCDNINNMINFAKKEGYNIKEENIQQNKKMNIKNIILYGAPGVGKTHNYKKLISLIEEGKYQKDIFETIQKNELNDNIHNTYKIVEDEKRVEFITFHQSFGYEDFIEGFRPQENGNIEIENGIFKVISQNAKNQSFENYTKTISFDDAYDTLRGKYFEEGLDKIYSVSNVEIIIHEFKENTIKVQSSNAKDIQYVKKSDLETVVKSFIKDEIEKPADIKKLDVKKDTISLAGLYYPIGKLISEIMKETQISVQKEKNFYLVIDEINRGNISKIFGELITLIEESKRDNYKVTLPYSKQKFSVPSNLYIIGTMNTTDKSIALIDVALRRRFTFIKMEPNPELVDFDNAKKLMNAVNKQIVDDGLGKEYQIGHSYFMDVTSDEELEFVKQYKLKPLLEEYYYENEKLKEVLKIAGVEDKKESE